MASNSGDHRQGLLARLAAGAIKRPLVGGAVGAFGLKLVNMALTLGTSVLLARLLGADAYGMYAFAIACVTLLEVPAQLGLPTLLVRWTAAYAATAEWRRLRGLVRRASQITAIGLIIIVAILAGMLFMLAANFEAEAVNTAAWALALVPLVVLGALRAAVLRGLHHVVLSQVSSMLVRPALFLLLLALVALGFGSRLTPSTAMALQVTATGAAFLLGLWWLWQRIPAPLRAAAPIYETRQWIRSAMPLMLVGSIGVLNSQVDILMLGLLRTSEEVGIYRVAVQAGNLVAFAATGISLVIAPTLSRLHVEGDFCGLQRVMTRSAQAGLFLFALPVALILIVFGDALLPVVFGSAFGAAYGPLAIICLGQLINAAAGSVGVLLSMTGHERDTAFGLSAAMMLNVPMNLALIPLFGASGAAAATTASIAVWNGFLAFSVYRRLAIRPTAFVRA